MSTTTRAEFTALLSGRRVVPVLRERVADEVTPVGLYRALAAGRPGTFLLESAEQGRQWSRYSFVGVGSHGMLTEQDGRGVWCSTDLPPERAFAGVTAGSPLDLLTALYDAWQSPDVPDAPPLTGGLVGCIGWDVVRELERLPHRPPTEVATPALAMLFVSELVVIDHVTGTVTLIATVLHDTDAAADALWEDAQRRLDGLEHALAQPHRPDIAIPEPAAPATPTARSSRAEYMAVVDRAKEYVRCGDVFQVVISQRFDTPVTADALDVYRVLRALNPSPYMYLFSLETADGVPYHVVGSSPEALVKVTDGRALSHPIAGSRPRGATPAEDTAYERELVADAKERAEHLMLVDLVRNDLARVCQAGSVTVTTFMQVERFSHIMHLVSTVSGELAPGMNAVSVFRATFPAGTLSGAPKPRALEIIDALEPAGRGGYGGVVGYFGFGGDADLAITIRTATLVGGVAHVQAGAGLVAESDPATEYEECRNKAAAPLRAIAIANALRREPVCPPA